MFEYSNKTVYCLNFILFCQSPFCFIFSSFFVSLFSMTQIVYFHQSSTPVTGGVPCDFLLFYCTLRQDLLSTNFYFENGQCLFDAVETCKTVSASIALHLFNTVYAKRFISPALCQSHFKVPLDAAQTAHKTTQNWMFPVDISILRQASCSVSPEQCSTTTDMTMRPCYQCEGFSSPDDVCLTCSN